MPRVPVYGNGTGPQVGANPLNAPVLPALRVATNGGDNALRVGKALSEVAGAIDEVRQNQAVIKAGELEIEGQPGWIEEQARLTRERAGAKAAGVGEDVDKYWNKFIQEKTPGLDRMAAEMASRTLRQAQLRSKAWAAGFELTETSAAAETSFKASKQLAIDTESTDPAVLAEARAQLRQRNAEWAGTKGLGEEWVQATNLSDLTKLHTNVLTRLANDPINPERAQAYYLEHQDEISDPGGAIKATVDEAVGIGAAQQVGMDVASQFSHMQTAQAVRAIQANDTLSRKQKEIAISRMEHMHALQSADQAAAERRMYEQAQLEYEKNGVVPPALMARLDPGAQAALLRQQKADTKALLGQPVQTDYAVYDELARKINDPSVDPSTIDLNQYYGVIDRGDLDKLQTMRTNRIGDSTGDAATTEQQLSTYVSQLDVPSDKGKANQVKGAFRAHVHRQLQLFTSENGRPPKFKEREEIISRALIRERDRWFARERYAFEVAGDPEAEADFQANLEPADAARLAGVPEEDAAQISAVLRKRGTPVTAENIARMYTARIRQQSKP
jgi:hypothetical protein